MTASARSSSSDAGSHLPVRSAIMEASLQDGEELHQLLLQHPSIDVVAKLLTPEAVCELFDRAEIRLLFCGLGPDPQATLAWLAERPPTVDVILSAHDERWAARAFEVDALDFLVKPLSKERLSRSIRRLLRLDWSGSAREVESGARVFVPFERGRRLISTDEICAIQAIGNYTQVLLIGGGTEIVMRPLRRWEETLPAGSFLRIHRSTLVNADRVRRLELTPEGDGALVEVDGLAEKLSVSRRCLASVRAVLVSRQKGSGIRK